MKKVVKLTESDLTKMIQRVVNEQEDDTSMDEHINWNIKTTDCEGSRFGNMSSMGVDKDEDGNISVFIRYCKGDDEELEYLKRKARRQIKMENQLPSDDETIYENKNNKKVVKLTESDLARIIKRVINESEVDESEVTPNMIIKMLMDSAESTPQENYDDPYDWMQDVFSPVESELEDMGVDIDDLRMTYDDVVMSLWEDNYDDDDFEDDDYELEESIRGNYRIRNWGPDTWHDEDDRAVNPNDIEDYEEEVEFGPDEYDRYMDYTKDIPNKWNFQYDKGYYDKHYKPGREIPIKIRKLRQR